MAFWTGSTELNVANMARLGPFVQGIVGTDGAYTDLYDAMDDPAGPQWRRVLVVPGATINTDVTISGANYGCILGAGMISLTGTGKISLTNCSGWIIANLRFNSTVTANGAINLFGTGSRNRIEGCWIYSSGGLGILIQTNQTWVADCFINTPVGDGIDIAAAVTGPVWISHTQIYGSAGGWGIQDNPDLAHIINCVVTGNASGQIDSSSAYQSNNQVA